jgi:hypothetical protein
MGLHYVGDEAVHVDDDGQDYPVVFGNFESHDAVIEDSWPFSNT